MKNIMGLIYDVVGGTTTEGGTDTILPYPVDSDPHKQTLGEALKDVWSNAGNFVNEHSKGFAIAISCFCALVVIAIVFWLFKKILCKKGRKYYRYRR